MTTEGTFQPSFVSVDVDGRFGKAVRYASIGKALEAFSEQLGDELDDFVEASKRR